MSKFLTIIEQLSPANANVVHKMFNTKVVLDCKDIDSNEVELTLADNTKVVLEIKSVSGSADGAEDAEDTIQTGPNKMLNAKQLNAMQVASGLVQDPRKRMFGADPKKALEKSLGDIYLKLADKIKGIASTIQ